MTSRSRPSPASSFSTAVTQGAASMLVDAMQAIARDLQVKPEEVQEVIMGCVLPAGQGQAPARQALRGAGVPDSAGALTINKMCGSGMKAVQLGAQQVALGESEVVLDLLEDQSVPDYVLVEVTLDRRRVPPHQRQSRGIPGQLPHQPPPQGLSEPDGHPRRQS